MDGRLLVSTATPMASTRTPIRPGTSASSIGVEAMHLPSRQWLKTTRRWPGCRVILSVAPRPRASGMLRRVGPTPRLWTLDGVVSRLVPPGRDYRRLSGAAVRRCEAARGGRAPSFGFPGEALVEPAPPDRQTTVIADHAACHAEKPEAPPRGRRDRLKPAPGDQKYLRNHVLDIVLDHASTDIRRDRLSVSAVERLESRRAVVLDLDCAHSARVHFSSFTQDTWPGQARIRQFF